MAFGAVAASGCSSGGGSKGIPCSGPEHCAPYGLVCSPTLTLCVQCNSSSDCSGAPCVNSACQNGSGGNGSGGSIGNGGTFGGSIGSGGTFGGSIGSGGSVAGSIGSGGSVAGSIGSGGSAAGSIGSGGTGGTEPICDASTPNGVSDCCPDALYPWWCWHSDPVAGHCFAYGVDCSTVTVCYPETFARACPSGDVVVCETCGLNYGHCLIYEPCN